MLHLTGLSGFAISGNFLPSQVPNLVGWWDAQDSSTFTFSTGTDVSQWNDKSGNGNHMAQGTASVQPLFVASAINSRPAVQFRDDGTVKALSVTDNATLDYTALDCFIVFQRVADLGAIETLFGKYNPTGNNREFHITVSAGDLLTMQGSTDGTSGTLATAQFAGALATGTGYIGEAYWDATNVGVSRNNGTPATGALATMFAGTSALAIGAHADGSNPYAGHIGEILFYKRYLSAAERSQIIAYLTRKWGIGV